MEENNFFDELAQKSGGEIILEPSVAVSNSETLEKSVHGLVGKEISDPNAIIVTIADKRTPILILFGPPACGKTMTLIRLARYLKGQGYKVSPIPTFRPSTDIHYKKICERFDEMINDNNAQSSTNLISFMLLKVSKGGKTLCQILEAPGEYYFNPQKPQASFPAYVNAIISSDNRKLWAITVEPNWLNVTDRSNYADKIDGLKIQLAPRDRILFIYNKIDKTDFVVSPGNVKIPLVVKDVEDNYVGIFKQFVNENPITRLWKKYNFDLVPFQTGNYNELDHGGSIYTPSPDCYPRQLWEKVRHLIIG